MCECKERKTCRDDLLSEYCIRCGRIWVNTLCGYFRPTDMFESIREPMNGVWIGHTFIKDKSGQLAKALRYVSR